MFPLIHLYSDFSIQTYIVYISVMLSFLAFWLEKRSRFLKLNSLWALDLAVAVLISGSIGARVMHVLLEEPLYYQHNISKIFFIWEGGFVFYGGLIGALLFASFISYFLFHDKMGPWLDLFAPVCAVGYAVGRGACLLAGCCHGKPTNLAWGIIYPPGVIAPAGVKLHPSPIYAFIWDMLIFVLLHFFEKRNKKRVKHSGELFWIWLILHSFGRFFQEMFRGDYRGTILGHRVSSFLSVLFFVSSILMLIRIRRKTVV